jgi:glycosyltransferase involved in cell wall biosynthesis
MACGKPSLSSTLGFEETMGEQANLLLFKQKDAENLAEKLAALLKLSLAERERIGLYLRERVIKMHSLERLADKLVNIFVQQRR